MKICQLANFWMKKILVFAILVLVFGCKFDSEKEILVLNKKAQDLVNKEDFQGAIKVLDKVENIDSNYLHISYTKAFLNLKSNNFSQAKIEINKEIKKDSLNAEVWQLNGIINKMLKDIDYSNQCFKKSIKFYETGKSNLARNDKDIDMIVFILLHIINDSESKIQKNSIKLKWKVDYKMSDFFKLDEETSEKALELLYK